MNKDTGRGPVGDISLKRALVIEAELEKFVDELGLRRVVVILAQIALAKSDHVSTNWQDQPLAAWWARRSCVLDTCADKIGMENT